MKKKSRNEITYPLLVLIILINVTSIFVAIKTPQALHFSEILLLVFCSYEFFFNKKKPTLFLIVIALIIITLSSLCFIKKDWNEILFLFSNIMSLYAFEFFFRDKYINLNIVPIFFLSNIIPVFLLFIFLPIPIHYSDWMDNSLSNSTLLQRIIPSVENNFQINIGAPNQTKHHTGVIGLILFLYLLFKKRGKFDLLIFLFSLYILLFSQSRSFGVSCVFCLTLYYINKSNFRPILSTILLVFIVSSTYFTETFLEFANSWEYINNSFVMSYLQRDTFNTDISSGRLWLQLVHLSYFFESPFIGVHSTTLFFSNGDITEWGIAQAATESFYTQLFALFGVFGGLYLFLHMRLWYLAITNKNLFQLILASCIIYLTATNSNFQNTYGLDSTVFYSLFFSKLSIKQ